MVVRVAVWSGSQSSSVEWYSEWQCGAVVRTIALNNGQTKYRMVEQKVWMQILIELVCVYRYNQLVNLTLQPAQEI